MYIYVMPAVGFKTLLFGYSECPKQQYILSDLKTGQGTGVALQSTGSDGAKVAAYEKSRCKSTALRSSTRLCARYARNSEVLRSRRFLR